jgi:hypothetical protein
MVDERSADELEYKTGMRCVEESEHGGLKAKDTIGGPQSTTIVASGTFGGDSKKDTAPLTGRYPVGSGVVGYREPKSLGKRRETGRR